MQHLATFRGILVNRVQHLKFYRMCAYSLVRLAVSVQKMFIPVWFRFTCTLPFSHTLLLIIVHLCVRFFFYHVAQEQFYTSLFPSSVLGSFVVIASLCLFTRLMFPTKGLSWRQFLPWRMAVSVRVPADKEGEVCTVRDPSVFSGKWWRWWRVLTRYTVWSSARVVSYLIGNFEAGW